MNTNVQIACAASGLVSILLLGLSLLLVGSLPPIAPSFSANEVAQFYQANTGVIRFGLLIGMSSSAFSLPLIALIAIHMRRTEETFPVLSITQALAGTVGSMILLIPFVVWSIAAYRIDRPPELILMLNDFGWIMFLMTFAPFLVQLGSLGLAIITDKNTKPIFPRWVGYYNLWTAILYMPGALIIFFKTGPFAFNGLLAFWLVACAFSVWYIVMFFVLLKVIKEHSQTDVEPLRHG